MSPLKLALLDLWRRPMATLVVVLSVAASIGVSGVLFRLHLVAEQRFASLAAEPDAVIGGKAGGTRLLLGALNFEGEPPPFVPYALFQTLRRGTTVRFEDGAASSPHFIRSLVPFVRFGRVGDFPLIGTDEQFLSRPGIPAAERVESGSWPSRPGEIAVGAGVARSRRVKVGDRITASGLADGEAATLLGLTVSAVLKPSGNAFDNAAYATIEEAWSVLAKDRQAIPWNGRVLHYFLAWLEPNGFTALEELINKRTVAEAIEVRDEIGKLKELSGIGRELGVLFCLLVIGLGALGAAGMIAIRFEGMGAELAILRALGYPKRTIRAWLLWEGFLLGAFSVAGGLVLDAIVFPWVRARLGGALPPPSVVGVGVLRSYPVWTLAIMGAMAAVAWPAIRASRQNVPAALRS